MGDGFEAEGVNNHEIICYKIVTGYIINNYKHSKENDGQGHPRFQPTRHEQNP